MIDFSIFPRSDPTPMLRQRDGLYAVELLSAAVIHLDLFTWLGKQPSSLAAICQAHSLHERPADVMMTLFRAMGLVHLGKDGLFQTTDLASEHMSAGTPWNMSPYFASMKNRPVCADILEGPEVWQALELGQRQGRAGLAQGNGGRPLRQNVHRSHGLPRPFSRSDVGQQT